MPHTNRKMDLKPIWRIYNKSKMAAIKFSETKYIITFYGVSRKDIQIHAEYLMLSILLRYLMILDDLDSPLISIYRPEKFKMAAK